MNVVPIDKHDLNSTKELSSISDNELEPHLAELFVWVQDLNWPVALPICKRLSRYRKNLSKPILDVLNSDDAIWKYNVITQIVTELSDPISEEIMEPIVRMTNSPSESEILEQVDLVAKDIIVRYSHGI